LYGGIKMAKLVHEEPPVALACGILEDSRRALFLCRKTPLGVETVELPCVLLKKGDNPVSSLAAEFHRQTGIDGQVHRVLFEKKHNAGSKKRKYWIPVLAFEVTAKNTSAKPAKEFSGYKWIFGEELGKHKLARNASFLR
jgi:hypothetical protein